MRRILLIAMAVFLALTCSAYAAKKFPSRNITNVVVWGAGGGTDTCNRIISAEMAPFLGVNVNVINKTGGLGRSMSSRRRRLAFSRRGGRFCWYDLWIQPAS